MSAKEYSLKLEMLLRRINPNMYGKSDEILLGPYKEIVSAAEFRVSKEKLERFKVSYQSFDGRKLQELMDNDYNIEQLLEDVETLIEDV